MSDKVAHRPLVSLLVDPSLDADRAQPLLRSFFMQGFYRFEVLVSENSIGGASEFQGFPNIRRISPDFDGACSWRHMAEQARGVYVAMVEDEVYWTDESLYTAWTSARNSKVDFVAMMPGPCEGIGGLRTALLVFDEHYRTRVGNRLFNSLDSSINNKLIKRKTVLDNDFFSNRSPSFVFAMYKKLTFSKKPEPAMLSALSEGDYSARASMFARVLYKPAYVLFRVTDDALWEKLHRVRLAIVEKALGWFRNKRIIRNQILFYSNRGTGDLTPNLKRVYDQLSGDKVVMTRARPHPRWYKKKLRKELKRSRVIVTDDYINELVQRPVFRFSDKQHVVQLWHACGAFKKFGLDCFGVPRAVEHQLHGQYDAVMVSSESVRKIYASAFGVPVEKVLALGTPRTDSLLDPAENEAIAARVLEVHPEFDGKDVILYCPTFRQKLERQVIWDPEIDWTALSDWLGEDKVFVVKKHPIDKTILAPAGFPNIICADNEDTNDLLRVTDVLVTDYSSVIFDGALLDIPIVFYCPDFDTFERDFYLRFPEDLPGPVYYSCVDLIGGIEDHLRASRSDKYLEFKRNYLSSCDGGSAKRIASYISRYV